VRKDIKTYVATYKIFLNSLKIRTRKNFYFKENFVIFVALFFISYNSVYIFFFKDPKKIFIYYFY